MDWLTLQGFIRNWFVEATGLPAEVVAWADQNRERDKYPYATLNLIMDTARGSDELAYEYDPDSETLVEHAYGIREFTVSLKVETLSQHPTQNARFYLTKARNSLSHSAAYDSFSDAGLAIIDLDATKQFDTRHALGMTSVCVMDLRLATMIDDFDVEKPTAFIDKAEMTGTVDAPPEITIGPDMYGNTD